jgi:hypothetical protein
VDDALTSFTNNIYSISVLLYITVDFAMAVSQNNVSKYDLVPQLLYDNV